MRSFITLLCLFSTAALADPPTTPNITPTEDPQVWATPTSDRPTPDTPKDNSTPQDNSSVKMVSGANLTAVLPDHWTMEFIQEETGKYSRIGGYTSKAACEAAIPTEMQHQRGDNAHCIEWKSTHVERGRTVNGGYFIGSQDPVWAGGRYEGQPVPPK